MPKFELLTMGNPKTAKGEAAGYLTFILHLAPASLSGWNVCPKATQGCIAACLNTAGRGGIFKAGETSNTIQRARIRRTRWYFEDRAGFMNALRLDIHKAKRHAAKLGLVPVFRLNGTSDIRWERVSVGGFDNIMDMFPEVQFYDYTKIANRRDIPDNYSLTFSLADDNLTDAFKALDSGLNVAAVFRSKGVVANYEANGWQGYMVRNGDESDLRFLDGKGHGGMGAVIALYAKGKAKRDRSGFVRD